MRKRDLGVLLVAAFAAFYTLQDDQGPFTFEKAWCAQAPAVHARLLS